MTSFARRLKDAAWLILAIAVVTWLLSLIGFFDPWRKSWFDAFSQLSRSGDSDTVKVVGIDEDDFNTTFGGTLPLNADPLAQVVTAIAAARPLAIGIDVQTSRPAFAGFWKRVHKALEGIPTVWVNSSVGITSQTCRSFLGRPCTYAAAPPLAGMPLDETGCVISCAGSEILLADTDNVVRSYSRYVLSGGTPPRIVYTPTLAWAVVGACGVHLQNCADIFKREPKGEEKGTEVRLIRFPQLAGNGRWKAYSVAELLHDAAHGRQNFDPLHGKIVLLGGAFPDSRDLHPTPVGDRYGVDIWAQIIEDELNGGLEEISEAKLFALDILCGIALVAIGAAFSVRKALALSLAAIPVLSFGASWLAFSSFTLWFDFVPMTAGIFLHTLSEHTLIYLRLRALHPEEVAELEGEEHSTPVVSAPPAAEHAAAEPVEAPGETHD